MANVRTLKTSFAGGVMSPEMFGRIDDQKFQSGAAKLRNFIALPQGPAENRAGFGFVRAAKSNSVQCRLIPFTFNTTQTMVLEMGAGYFRFHTNGSTLLAGSPAAYNNATSYSVGALVSRTGVNYYCISATTGNTPPNATYWYPLPSDAYEIPNPFAAADLFDIHYVQSADILTFTHPNYLPRELRRLGATNWTMTSINFNAPIAAPTGVSVSVTWPTPGDGYNFYYQVTAVATDGFSESVASSSALGTNNLYQTGATNTISWSAVSGASRYKVFKLQGGIYGYIGQTDGLSIVDDNIAPDLSITPKIYNNDFTSSGNYPSAVSYFEQRRCFAGTINEPQKIWMTRSGTESDMSYSIPTRDDDRIEFRVAAREANTIRHIIPLTQLLLLTAAAEWRVSSVNSDVVTPSSISVRPQSYVGASNVQPAIINNSLVYCAARGGHVRELGYSWQSNGFITGDLSLRAAHLFDTYELVDMCYSKAPHPIIWFVSTSGDLIGLTYIPEQQLGAWHHHDTDGVFESCTVVAEGGEDVLYVVVKRTVNGSTVRYIERQASRVFENVEECFFVDSGLTYNGTNTTAVTMTVTGGTTWGPADSLTITASSATFAYPATTDVGDAIVLTGTDGTQYRILINATSSTTVATGRVDKVIPAALRSTATTSWSFARNSISGLSHLEGKTVNILTDGAVHPQRVVTSGSIDLERAATIVTVGLPIIADMQTLPMAAQIDAGFGQGRVKNVNKAWLRVFQSSGIFIGPNENNLVEAKQRSTEPYGTAPALKSQEILIVLTPTWADSGQVFVRQSDPLPLTLVGMTLEVSMGA
jgi:hypothetical protein